MLALPLEAAREPSARVAGVWSYEAAEAGLAAVLRQGTVREAQATTVLPGCGAGVTLGLKAAWVPMTGPAGVRSYEAAEAGLADVLKQGTDREAHTVLPGWGVGGGRVVHAATKVEGIFKVVVEVGARWGGSVLGWSM